VLAANQTAARVQWPNIGCAAPLHWLRRYGWVNVDMLEALREGTEVFMEALEQVRGPCL